MSKDFLSKLAEQIIFAGVNSHPCQIIQYNVFKIYFILSKLLCAFPYLVSVLWHFFSVQTDKCCFFLK